MKYITVCYELYSSPSVPPFIEAASPAIEIIISEPAILVCLFTGFPMPEITWLKNNQEFSERNIFEFRLDFSESDRDSGSGSGSISELIADLLRL